jgi:hypothetical protein
LATIRVHNYFSVGVGCSCSFVGKGRNVEQTGGSGDDGGGGVNGGGGGVSVLCSPKGGAQLRH